MTIEYKPSRSVADYVRWEDGRRYVERYVLPLGRGRKEILLAEGEVVLLLNRPGAMGAIPIFLELAAGSLDNMEWEEVQESPGTGWWGDLDPGSPVLYMKRVGPRIELPDGFLYQPPPYGRNEISETDRDLAFSITIDRANGPDPPFVALSASAIGFLTLAREAAYLAQEGVPSNARISHRGSRGETDIKPSFALQLTTFPANVPWNAPPRLDGK